MRKLIVALLASLFLFTGMGQAMTCLEPVPIDGYEYLSIQYDPKGNAIVFIDQDADGKADFVQAFMLRRVGGEVMLVPQGPAMDPEFAAKRIQIVNKHNKASGFESKCFDIDLGQLRNESDRWS